MANYSNINDLYNAIKNEVNNVMDSDEYKGKMKDVMIRNIEEEVYEKYDPNKYDRKMNKGGLTDKDNILTKMEDDSVLRMRSIRRNSAEEYSYGGEDYSPDRDIAEIIETGEGYNWAGVDKKGRTNAVPRPFTEATREDFRENKDHVKELKNGLSKKGIDIE